MGHRDTKIRRHLVLLIGGDSNTIPHVAAKGISRSLTMGRRFEWDQRKADSNFKKHKISFQEATSVFANALSISKTGLFQVKGSVKIGLRSAAIRNCLTGGGAPPRA